MRLERLGPSPARPASLPAHASPRVFDEEKSFKGTPGLVLMLSFNFSSFSFPGTYVPGAFVESGRTRVLAYSWRGKKPCLLCIPCKFSA